MEGLTADPTKPPYGEFTVVYDAATQRTKLQSVHSNSFWHYLAVNRLRAASDGNLGAGPADNAEPPENEEPDMSNRTELIDRSVAMWNETDASSRRDPISRT